LEAAPEHRPRSEPAKPVFSTTGPLPFALSARTPEALRAGARRLRTHLEESEGVRPVDVGYSLATTRSALPHRAVVVGEGVERLLQGLWAVAEAAPAAHVIDHGAGGDAQDPVFVFPGQGGQWPGMAVELIDGSPVFADQIRACGAALSPHVEFDLEGVLRGDTEQPALERVEVVQPVLFAVMVSLAALWKACGVRPAAVVGHSQGEITAAHVAGGLSLADAAHIVAARSRALARIEGQGGMMSVALSAEELAERADGLGELVTLAAVNGPASVVVSGDREALDALQRSCDADEVRARRILVSYASHSPRVEPAREELLEALAGIEPRASEVPLYSTVTGGPAATQLMDAEHWYRNLRETVQYAAALESLLRDGRRNFIEVSPHPVLTFGTAQTAEAVLTEHEQAAVIPTLRRDEGGRQRFLTSLAELYVRGAEVEWGAVYAASEPRRVRLPSYPFQRERHWIDAAPPAGDVPLTKRASTEEAAAVDEPDAPAAGAGSPFAARLAALPERARRKAALDVVLAQVAVVLGHGSADAVDAHRAFKELGFDSPAAVELRNRLARATGLRLQAGLVFDHPTPSRVADQLLVEALGHRRDATEAVRAPRPVDEPIAIVGIACRYPGGARSAEDLWDLVASGRDGIGDFPSDRGWDLERLVDPDRQRPGTTYARHGGFIYDAADFDAEHFAISPREALAMDPQQRLLLECAWEALEDAGIDPLGLRGTLTGTFAGVSGHDYGPRMQEGHELSQGYALTGTSLSVVSGRVAYVLGLEGPAVSVDTACSASLVALHLACQALRQGECDIALAGGATVMASPGVFVDLAGQSGLSPDGRCRAYGAGANGTGFSEGVGLLVLEPLSVAEAEGRPALAVVRGSAINQDGASNGLTAPSGPSQERVIRQALASAGMEAGEVDAVEGHGTGTALGDPIEARALIETYGRDRADRPLWLGSVKSNIGHTQAAAGVAGVIKMVMALRHGRLPATLYAEEASPHVDWGAGEVKLLSEAVEWPAGDRRRRAGVSSFGISGTNAHLILEEAPIARKGTAADRSQAGVPGSLRGASLPFLVSGSSEAALRDQARGLASHLEDHPEPALDAVAATLALGRAQLPRRAAVIAADRNELVSRLRAFAGGEPTDGVIEGVSRGDARVAFVFPGHGGQWDGMALGLWDSSPVFAQSMEACAAALETHLDWSLEDVLRAMPGAPGLERVDVVQPALFAVTVSLAALWRSFGVQPAAVVGHSLGEIAAAHVAGGLSLEDAARIVSVRSRALSRIDGAGGTMSVALSADELAKRADGLDGRITLAAVNAPASVVVSGDLDALDELERICEADEIQARRVLVGYATHSPHVEAAREELLGALADLEPRPGDVALYSTVTGGPAATELMGADHWYRNIRKTVQFEAAVRTMAETDIDVLIEVGPHPVLLFPALQTLESAGDAGTDVAAIGSLRRDEGGLERFARSLAEAHLRGVRVDWEPLFAGAERVRLPSYAFQRRRYWLASTPGGKDPQALAAAGNGGSGLVESNRPPAAPRRVDSDAIRAEIAATLGYRSPGELDMELSFLELGTDSLIALELRNRLRWLTGLALPTTLRFDRLTPAALVAQIHAWLAEPGATGRPRESSALTSISGDRAGAPAGGGAGEPLSGLLRRAHALGRLAEGVRMIDAASRLRPRFGLSHAEERASAPIPISEGVDEPVLFCFPSVIATAGPHEFSRLAQGFGDRREVVALPNPGYAVGELLPSTVEAVAATQAVAIERHAEGRSFALIGYSLGGLLAHAAAAQCARDGVIPASVVLIDTQRTDRMSDLLAPLLERMLETERAHPGLTDDALTAMVAYFRLLQDWRPAEPVAPTLLVAADDATSGAAGANGGSAISPPHDARIAVAADHLTILEDRADATAQLIDEWVGTMPPAPQRGRFARLLRQR
jgi:8,8a-deoxyoleandolide synthase